MATLTEVWVDDYQITIIDARGSLRVTGTAATFDADGQRIRVGSDDITNRLTPEALAAIAQLVAEVQEIILAQCEIDAADLLPEPPFPPTPEVLVSDVPAESLAARRMF
jgi:hypothetical protein